MTKIQKAVSFTVVQTTDQYTKSLSSRNQKSVKL